MKKSLINSIRIQLLIGQIISIVIPILIVCIVIFIIESNHKNDSIPDDNPNTVRFSIPMCIGGYKFVLFHNEFSPDSLIQILDRNGRGIKCQGEMTSI